MVRKPADRSGAQLRPGLPAPRQACCLTASSVVTLGEEGAKDGPGLMKSRARLARTPPASRSPAVLSAVGTAGLPARHRTGLHQHQSPETLGIRLIAY